jgi:hypothetical protein
MSDVIDIDPSLRALDALAEDFADPGEETPACVSMWPLLAVPTDALSPLDRDARDRHLARCARCRVALADAWLDAGDLAPTKATIPAATALPPLPDRKRRGVRILAGISVAAAAAASIVAIVAPLTSHVSAPTATTSQPRPALGPAPPMSLVILVGDSNVITPAARDRALAALPDHLPADTRITVARVVHRDLRVIVRDVPSSWLRTPAIPSGDGTTSRADADDALRGAEHLFANDDRFRGILALYGTFVHARVESGNGEWARFDTAGMVGVSSEADVPFAAASLVDHMVDEARDHGPRVIFVDHPAAPHDR